MCGIHLRRLFSFLIATTTTIRLVQTQLSVVPPLDTHFNFIGADSPFDGDPYHYSEPIQTAFPGAGGQVSQSGLSPPHGPAYLGGNWIWTTTIFEKNLDQFSYPGMVQQQF